MKRKLLKQIKTEWRSNTWLAVELIIVSIVLWYICDMTSYQISTRAVPMGLDTDNVYFLEFGYQSKSAPSYIKATPQGDETERKAESRATADAYNTIVGRLKALPYVENIGYSSNIPYNYNFYGRGLIVDTQENDTLNIISYLNNINVSTDYPKVFNLHGINGETPDQLSRLLEEGKILLTENAATRLTANAEVPPLSLINRKVHFKDEEEKEYIVGAVIKPIKRAEYEYPYHATVLVPKKQKFSYSILIRVKEGQGQKLEEYLKSAQGQKELSVFNLYPVKLQSLKSIRDILHRDDDATLRNLIIAMSFLLLTVFLGLLGTFWFRTQQRVREIAIRKVNGASRSNIFRRLISEGLLLLLLVYPIVFVIESLLVHYGISIHAMLGAQLQDMSEAWLLSLYESLFVFALMSVMIIAGIYFPARKAMTIEPADVLRGE